MLSLQDIDNIVLNGGIVLDVTGEKIGSVEQVFTSGDSGDPVFVTVRTGLFGMSESFAPLSGASIDESVIRVAFTKDKVKNGPRIDSDRGAITETQEQELYSYYGLDGGVSKEGSATGAGQEETPAAAGGTVQAETGADVMANAGRMEGSGEPHSGQMPPHPPPHGVPPPPPPHLRKHVPLPPRPHPGPHPPLRAPGPRPETGPIR
jgi:hypothetical protein